MFTSGEIPRMGGSVSMFAVSAYLFRDATTCPSQNKPQHQECSETEGVRHIFVFSKRKGDTVFDMTAQTDLAHIMRTGKVPAGSRAEWFWRGTRLIGSRKTLLLPPGLQEATTAVPLHPTLRRIVDKRDRCTAQYQGKDAFYSNQEFPYRTIIADNNDNGKDNTEAEL